MNQRERLAICSGCTRRKLDFEHGYVCSLTGKEADFKDSCKDYVRDEIVDDTIKIRTEDRPFVPLFDPPCEPAEAEIRKKAVKKKAAGKATARKTAVKKVAVQKGTVARETASKAEGRKKKPSTAALKKVRRYQNFLYALLGGVLFTVAASLGWALTGELTGYQGAYLAFGVALMVGIAVRYFGAGINRIFGVLAALLALAGSLLGHYLSQAGYPEELELAGMIRVLDFLRPDLMLSTLGDTFVPLDLLYYVPAVLLAYLLAIRRISSGKMDRLERDDYRGAPAMYWLRLPLILILIAIPAYFGYTHNVSGPEPVGTSTLYYDSGAKSSEGEMQNGLETGEWTSWYENGNIRSKGYYTEGQKDSLWLLYDESGVLTESGMYAGGVENGTWIHYYPDGVVADSGSYLEGLKEGLWEYYHETGSLKSSVNYMAGKMHGEKILVSASGTVVKVEYFENGILIDSPR